jgi:hypothetical protein
MGMFWGIKILVILLLYEMICLMNLDENLHFFTYFSKEYLVQGTAALASFISYHPNSSGFAVSLDSTSTKYLQNFKFADSLKIIELSDLTDLYAKFSELLVTRTFAEAILSIKPFLAEDLIAKIPEGHYLLYFDADLFFFRSLISELDLSGSAHLYISLHLFPPRMQQSVAYGKYNAGFFIVRNVDEGRAMIKDWREKCDQWCFFRLEDGKFADQKYLDGYYPGVGVVQIDSPGINNGQYFFQVHRNIVYKRSSGSTWIEHKFLTCFHFHGFRINQSFILTGFNRYSIPKNLFRVMKHIYWPYIKYITMVASRYENSSQNFWSEISSTPGISPTIRYLIQVIRFTLLPRKFVRKGWP